MPNKTQAPPDVRIAVNITPNAAANTIMGWSDDILRIRVQAPPVDGKANKELLGFLRQATGLAKNKIRLLRGETSRQKWIAFIDIERTELLRRINSTR